MGAMLSEDCLIIELQRCEQFEGLFRSGQAHVLYRSITSRQGKEYSVHHLTGMRPRSSKHLGVGSLVDKDLAEVHIHSIACW